MSINSSEHKSLTTSTGEHVKCVFTIGGSQVFSDTMPFPGMETREIPRNSKEKYQFYWDHVTKDGTHVFRGEKL